MTALTLHSHEVRAFLAGRLGVIVRPLRFQPRDGYSFDSIHGDLALFKRPPRPDDVVALPIPRGPFWGQETWAPIAGGTYTKKEYGTVYRADSDCQMYWRPPITMAKWRSRISGTVADSRVCRVGEVTGAEVFAWGRYSGFLTDPELGFPRAQEDLRDFWRATYRDYDANPWVQVARIERSE